MTAALGWGALAASSLVVGALLGLARRWPDGAVGLVLAFGAGALISAVSFDLAEEGVKVGGGAAVGVGLAIGALTYWVATTRCPTATRGPRSRSARSWTASPSRRCWDRPRFRRGRQRRTARGDLRLQPAGGDRLGGGHAGLAGARSSALWVAVAVVCMLATVAGYAIADSTGGKLRAAIDGFAAGALLVMLIDSMIPEARAKGGDKAGLVTVLGFAVATALTAMA